MGEKKYAATEATTHMSLSLLSSAKVRKNLEVCKYYIKFNVSTWLTSVL